MRSSEQCSQIKHKIFLYDDINGGLTASDSIFYVNFEPIRLKQSGYSVKKSCFENKLSDKTDFVVGKNCRAEFSILSEGQNLQ